MTVCCNTFPMEIIFLSRIYTFDTLFSVSTYLSWCILASLIFINFLDLDSFSISTYLSRCIYTFDSFSISTYLSRCILAGLIFINFLDLRYFTTNIITIIATRTRIIKTTNKPLHRMLFPRRSGSVHKHSYDLESF